MVDVLQTAKHYGAAKFVDFVEQAGLAERFKKQGPFTLFAPIDNAFEVKFATHPPFFQNIRNKILELFLSASCQ